MLAMASTWEMMLLGGSTPVRAPTITCSPWMILSSRVGAGTTRCQWQNSIVSEITWLLASELTSLKQQ
jgi:hypothetical protein